MSLIKNIQNFLKNSSINFLPLIGFLKAEGYSIDSLKNDTRAGLNVALLAFPQGMAYAAIAGLPIQYGLYGSAVAAILGPLFSGSRFIVLGPTNATSVLIFASFLGLGISNPETKAIILPLIVLLSGVFLILGSFLKVANLIQYVSRSVVTGYITAAAIYIIVNQLKKVLGFTFELPDGATFLTVIWLTLKTIPLTHWPTLVLSLITAGIYTLIRRKAPSLPNVAITLVCVSVVAYFFNGWIVNNSINSASVTLSAINAKDWSFSIPSLRGDSLSQIASISLVIAFLSVLEGTSIGKSLASRAGKKLDANQEMYGMGVANVGCAFLQGMPASGSLTRSQLNWESGAATPISSIISGIVVAAGAIALGPFTRFIPVSVLGVLVIAIGLSLINKKVIRVVWHSTGSDRIVFICTFFAALLVRLDFAIILGTFVSILLFLRKAAQPELIEYTQDEEGQLKPLEKNEKEKTPEVSIVHVEGDLFFGAAELFRDQMRRVCEKPNLKIVILKMRNAHHLDATSVLALEELVSYIRQNDRSILVSEVRKDAIRIFKNSGLMEVIGRDNIFPDNSSNPTISSAKAIRRAMQLLDGQEADVKIFLGGSNKNKDSN